MLNSTTPSLRKRNAINASQLLLLAICFGQFTCLQAQVKKNWWTNMPPPKVHSYDICFPADVLSNTCVAPTNIPGVQAIELGDDKLAVNVTDKIYRTSADACYKIFRTYTVMNWELYNEKCQLDPMANPVIVDRDEPVLDGNYGEGVCVLVRGNEAYFSSDRVISSDDRKITLSPICLDNGGFHYRAFMYTQVIKVYDDVRPVVTVPTLPKFSTDLITCKGAIEVTFRASDNCSDQVSLEVPSIMIAPLQTLSQSAMRMPVNYDTKWSWKDNKNGTFTIKIANLPEGKHDLIAVVRDQCSNLSLPTRIPFEIIDKNAPSPICKQGLSLSLMDDGQGGGVNTVWATDFVASPIYDCNGQGPETNKDGLKKITLYSINRVGETPKPSSTSLTFTCAEAVQKIDVELHAWDALGNHAYCVTYILVQDNRRICPIPPGINGSIVSALGQPLEKIGLLATQKDSVHQTETSRNGIYRFPGLPEESSYTVRPWKKDQGVDGVSTVDLTLLLDIVQGKLTRFNAYQILAADVDQNGEVNVDDFSKLLQIIYKRDSFPGGNCWRFVDADHKLSVSQKPGAYPDSVWVKNLETGVIANFVAFRLGDIDGSYNSKSQNSLTSDELLDLSAFDLKQIKKNLNPGLILGQNQPNPFQDETTINFHLPQAGLVDLMVWDVQGKSIYTTSNNLPNGDHQLILNSEQLGTAKGVFYYTLRTAFGTETRKILRF